MLFSDTIPIQSLKLWLAYLLEVTWRNPCEIAVFDVFNGVLPMGTPQIGDVWTWLQVGCSFPPSLLSVRFTPSTNQKFEYQIKKRHKEYTSGTSLLVLPTNGTDDGHALAVYWQIHLYTWNMKHIQTATYPPWETQMKYKNKMDGSKSWRDRLNSSSFLSTCSNTYDTSICS